MDLNSGASEDGLTLSLQLALNNVALQEFVWKKDGRSVARGILSGSLSVDDLSASPAD